MLIKTKTQMNANLKRKLEQAITVQELKDILENYNPEMKVMFSYNYGDHWNTKVVQPITSEPEEQSIEYSDYHNMCKISDDEMEDGETVLIIR